MNEDLIKKKCYACGNDATANIILAPQEVYSCDSHFKELYHGFLTKKAHTKCNLGQTADKWRTADGTVGRITEGKKSEIEWRRVTPEGEVINAKTKRPAQY